MDEEDRGRIYYFGKWGRRVEGKLTRVPGDGWEDALREYKEVADDLHAGRTLRVKGNGLTVADLCNRFLTAKLWKQEAGEIGTRAFTEYKETTDLIVSGFGANRLVDDLAVDDFESLRAAMARQWGPVQLANAITRVRSVFKYGTDNGLIEKTVRFGSEFRKPDQSVLRRHRAKTGERMFSAAEVRSFVEGVMVPGGDRGPELLRADPQLRAMILLGINAGFGNRDCATLPFSAADLDRGWINFPRPRTGIPRPSQSSAKRSPCGPSLPGSRSAGWFSSARRATPGFGTGERRTPTRSLSSSASWRSAYRAIAPGLGFYVLSHTFRAVADAARPARRRSRHGTHRPQHARPLRRADRGRPAVGRH